MPIAQDTFEGNDGAKVRALFFIANQLEAIAIYLRAIDLRMEQKELAKEVPSRESMSAWRAR